LDSHDALRKGCNNKKSAGKIYFIDLCG